MSASAQPTPSDVHQPRQLARKAKPWLKVPAWQLQELGLVTSGKAQLLIVLRIKLKVFEAGAGRNEEEDAPEWSGDISLRTLAGFANVSTEAAGMAVRDAVRRKVIAQRAGSKPGMYQFRVLENEWKFVPDYEPPKLEKKPARQADTAESEGEDKAQEVRSPLRSVPDAPVPVQVTAEPLVVLPGAKSRPVPLSTACRGFVVDEVSTPLAISATLDGAQVLHFLIRGAPPGAGEVRSPLRTFSLQASDSKASAILKKRVSPLLRRHGASVDDTLAASILQRLGGCPVDSFVSEAAKALGKTGVRNPKGLLVRIAEQCADSHRQEAQAGRDEAAMRALDERAKRHHHNDFAQVAAAYADYLRRGKDVRWFLETFPELAGE